MSDNLVIKLIFLAIFIGIPYLTGDWSDFAWSWIIAALVAAFLEE